MVDDNSMIMDEGSVLLHDYYVVENYEHFSAHFKFFSLKMSCRFVRTFGVELTMLSVLTLTTICSSMWTLIW